jgi:hypothetical protein
MGLIMWVFIGVIFLYYFLVLFAVLFIDDKWQYYGFNYAGLY